MNEVLGQRPRLARGESRHGPIPEGPVLVAVKADVGLRGRGRRDVERYLLAPVRHAVCRVEQHDGQARCIGGAAATVVWVMRGDRNHVEPAQTGDEDHEADPYKQSTGPKRNEPDQMKTPL